MKFLVEIEMTDGEREMSHEIPVAQKEALALWLLGSIDDPDLWIAYDVITKTFPTGKQPVWEELSAIAVTYIKETGE